MAESAASAKLAKLRAQRREAMMRAAGGAREDAAIEKATDSPAATEEEPKVDEAKAQANRTVRKVNKQSNRGDANTYQRHVLFAIVVAFLVKIASAGKTSLTK